VKLAGDKMPLLILLVFAIGTGWLMARDGGSSRTTCGPGVICPSRNDAPAAPSEAAAAPPVPVAKGVPRLVELGSTTCVPCKMMTPILGELEKEYRGKLRVEFINVSRDPSAARSYGVRAIPTQVLYDKSGKEVYRHVGFYPKEDILAKFKEHGVRLDKESNHE
jgi:thioredoxin 1